MGAPRQRTEPLWDRVDRNRRKVAVFVVVMLVATAVSTWLVTAVATVVVALFVPAVSAPTVAGWLYAGTVPGWLRAIPGWVTLVVTAVSAVRVAMVLSRSERALCARLGALRVQQGELLDTKYALKDMSLAAGLAHAPQLYVIDSPNVNAFVVGRRPETGLVGVTTGFAERLSRDDQRAAFANLMARLGSGDTIWATAVSAVLEPVWRIREADLRGGDDLEGRGTMAYRWAKLASASGKTSGSADGGAGGTLGLILVALVVPYAVMVVLTEFITWGFRAHQLEAAEKADAEGMLLLKDPRAALRALERTVRMNNYVAGAGPSWAPLFYAWSDSSSDDEDDPEVRRLTRLREVLGAEGMAEERTWRDAASSALEGALPPPPPRLAEEDDGAA